MILRRDPLGSPLDASVIEEIVPPGVVRNVAATPLMRFPALAALARIRMRRGEPGVEEVMADCLRHDRQRAYG